MKDPNIKIQVICDDCGDWRSVSTLPFYRVLTCMTSYSPFTETVSILYYLCNKVSCLLKVPHFSYSMSIWHRLLGLPHLNFDIFGIKKCCPQVTVQHICMITWSIAIFW